MMTRPGVTVMYSIETGEAMGLTMLNSPPRWDRSRLHSFARCVHRSVPLKDVANKSKLDESVIGHPSSCPNECDHNHRNESEDGYLLDAPWASRYLGVLAYLGHGGSARPRAACETGNE